MNKVFVDITYSVLDIPGMFKQLRDFIGEIQVEQSVEQSIIGVMRFWFYTDKIEIKEGELRQVEITAKRIDDSDRFEFTIEKIR